jgi:hypothetical protein
MKLIKGIVDRGDLAGMRALDDELIAYALEMIEETIATDEQERSLLEERLADPTFYHESKTSSDAVRRFEELQQRLETLYERWEAVGRMIDQRRKLERSTP